MVGHKYAVFYPEHTGYLHVERLGNDGSADLIWSIRDKKPYMRRKETPWDRKRNETGIPEEIKHYKDVAGVPTLIHVQSLKHLLWDVPQHETFRSTSLICEFCNGGNLGAFQCLLKDHTNLGSERDVYDGPASAAMSQLQSDEALEIFIWHFFDSVLKIFDRLHAQGLCHERGYNLNVFFHFTDRAKLPEILLGNLHLLGAREAGKSDQIELAGLYYNLLHIMYREHYDLVDFEIDLALKAKHGAAGPKYSDELLQCHSLLGQLCRSELTGAWYVSSKEIGSSIHDWDPSLRELKATVAKHAKRAKANLKTIPDLSGLRRDKPTVSPTLYSTRQELLEASLEDPNLPTRGVSGPWRIAHVDPKTFEILAVEEAFFNLQEPYLDPCNDDRLPYKVEDPRIKSCVPGVSNKSFIDYAGKQDKIKGNELAQPWFGIDREFTKTRLYDAPHTCETCVVRGLAPKVEPAENDKKEKKSKTPTTKTKGSGRKASGAASTTPSKPKRIVKREPTKQKGREANPAGPSTRRSRRLRAEPAENRGLPL